MPQALTPDMLNQEEVNMDDEYIHTLEGAMSYFAYCEHNGKRILAIWDFEQGKWRPTTQQEVMNLMQ